MHSPGTGCAKPGISLIEVMMILMLMALVLVPATMMLGQTLNTSQGSYTQANRSNLGNTLASQITPGSEGLATQMDLASQSTVYKEPNSAFTGSRNTIPFITKQDATNSNGFTKLYQLYEYNNGAASSAPRITSLLYDSSDELRIDLGSSTSTMDSSLRPWGSASYIYDATTKRYGSDNSVHTISNATAGNPSNLYNTVDQSIYSTQDQETYPNYIVYQIPVENGYYTVQLLFNENCSTCTRAMDIKIEAQVMNEDDYDPYVVTGSTLRAHILSYDTVVSDNVLRVEIRPVNSGEVARCSGIVVYRRNLP